MAQAGAVDEARVARLPGYVDSQMKHVFADANLSPAWDLNTVTAGPFGIALPRLANGALWGGLWGALFALIFGNVPQGSMTLRGALLGLLGPAVACVFLVFPMLHGTAPFLGGDVPGLIATLATFAGFGAATAWLYGFFTAGCRLP
jgi:hypothetical protein